MWCANSNNLFTPGKFCGGKTHLLWDITLTTTNNKAYEKAVGDIWGKQTCLPLHRIDGLLVGGDIHSGNR